MDESFGIFIKQEREKKSLSLEEISTKTKIHIHNLILIEESRWDELPPSPFVRGFIIAYAKALQLDSREILEKYYLSIGKPFPTSLSSPSLPHSELIPSPLSSSKNPMPFRPPPTPKIEKNQIFRFRSIATTFVILSIIGITYALIYIGKNYNIPLTTELNRLKELASEKFSSEKEIKKEEKQQDATVKNSTIPANATSNIKKEEAETVTPPSSIQQNRSITMDLNESEINSTTKKEPLSK